MTKDKIRGEKIQAQGISQKMLQIQFFLKACSFWEKFLNGIFKKISGGISFLAVQNSSIGLIVRPLLCLSVTTNNQSLHNTTEWT